MTDAFCPLWQCDFRLIHCEHCNGDRLAKDFPRHAQLCAKWPVDCSDKTNGCVASIKRGQVDAHTSVCPYNKCVSLLPLTSGVKETDSYPAGASTTTSATRRRLRSSSSFTKPPAPDS